MTEPTVQRLSPDAETAIAGYRRQVRRALEQAGRTHDEADGIVADVEQHLRAQLPRDATLAQAEAVLARMDPPSAFAGEESPAGASPVSAPSAARGGLGVWIVALAVIVAAASGLYYLSIDRSIALRHALPATSSTTPPMSKARHIAIVTPPAAAVSAPIPPLEGEALPSRAPVPVRAPTSIAVLSFQGSENLANRAAIATELTDGIINVLAANPGFRVVEREQLQAAFQELRLSMDGAVQQDTAANVGRLIGAGVIVYGNLTRVADTLTVSARLLNPETGELAMVRTEGTVGGVAALADTVAAKIVERVDVDAKGTFARAADTTAAATASKLAEVRAGLAGKTLPRVIVMIPESHLGAYVRDPAAETELVRWLTECGFAVASPEYEGVQPPRPVTDITSDTAIAFHRNAGWRNVEGDMTIASRTLRESVTGGLAAEREKLLKMADVLIMGEGISERGSEREGLISAKGRVELKVVDVRTGRVLLAASEYGAGIDVAERIAGKRALQAAGGTLAETLIPDMVAKWDARPTL